MSIITKRIEVTLLSFGYIIVNKIVQFFHICILNSVNNDEFLKR